MSKIRYFSKSIDDKLIADEKKINHADFINIGNPISVYRDGVEQTISSMYLKITTLVDFLTISLKSLQSDKRFTIAYYGCGNGYNARQILRLVNEINNKLKLRIVYIDVSSELLYEADKRSNFMKLNSNIDFDWELVQIDLSDASSISKFTDHFLGNFNFSFSVKCFHNTFIKINRDIARMISLCNSKDSVFLNQFYGHNFYSSFKQFIKLIIGKRYSNSIYPDRFLANLYLKYNGFDLQYRVTSMSMSEVFKTNHFKRLSIESYYLKK